MVVGAKVCELTDGFLWFVCGLYVGILTSPLTSAYPENLCLHCCTQSESKDTRLMVYVCT